MSSKPMPPTPLRQEDYLAIEAAVMETARGRWFLAEYARRNRNADTDTLLTAIDKLEKTIVRERAPSSLMHQVRMDLADMANAIERTKTEIAQIKHEDNEGAERFERATVELDAIVSQTESATGDILGAAEKIQEFAWTLREMGADSDKCDELDMEATNIYMACSFQDLTGQRIRKIVDAMRYVESRINSMIDIWGFESEGVEVDQHDHRRHDTRPDAHLLNGPQLEGEGVGQDDVDDLFNAPDLYEQADQNDVDALFDNNDQSDQSDVDALFDNAGDAAETVAEPAEADSDLSAEMSQNDADALFDTAAEVLDADVIETEAEDADIMDIEAEEVEEAAQEAVASDDDMMDMSGEADDLGEIELAGEVDMAGEMEAPAEEAAAEMVAEAEVDVDVVDVESDVMDMQDLDWASEGEAETEAEAEAESDSDAADYLATVDADAVMDAGFGEAAQGDIFDTLEQEETPVLEEASSEEEDELALSAMAEDDEDLFNEADVFKKALNDDDMDEEEPLDLRDRVAQFS